jgi:multidrug efflux pump subunit AcrB
LRLALAVGILVDEATVCIENIHVHLARGQPLARGTLEATTETIAPRLLAMLCILAIFTPALFMVGAAKAMFLPLSLAVGFSMIASYFLSSTLVPILVVWMERRARSLPAHESDGGTFARFRDRYTGVVRSIVAWRGTVVTVYLVLAVSILLLLTPRLGTEIFPQVDAGCA